MKTRPFTLKEINKMTHWKVKTRVKSHYRKVPVTRDPEEHFRRPLYSRVRVKSYLRKVV